MAIGGLDVNVTQEALTVEMPQIDRPCQDVTQSECYLEDLDRDALKEAPHSTSFFLSRSRSMNGRSKK